MGSRVPRGMVIDHVAKERVLPPTVFADLLAVNALIFLLAAIGASLFVSLILQSSWAVLFGSLFMVIGVGSIAIFMVVWGIRAARRVRNPLLARSGSLSGYVGLASLLAGSFLLTMIGFVMLDEGTIRSPMAWRFVTLLGFLCFFGVVWFGWKMSELLKPGSSSSP